MSDICPKCSSPRRIGANYCYRCGTKLVDVVTLPADVQTGAAPPPPPLEAGDATVVPAREPIRPKKVPGDPTAFVQKQDPPSQVGGKEEEDSS